MKISIVGGGNAGCFTALYLAWHCRKRHEVELIYDPSKPPERVGQASLLNQPALLFAATGFNWYHNPIHATFKTGILYEGWGKKNAEVFHAFPSQTVAMHYCPWELQQHILKCGLFKVTEGDVDPKDVDADYVFDCRGKPKDYSQYTEVKNPTNACILGKPSWNTGEADWSRHVATPDGWTFVIPTHPSSPSNDYCVGYCYNSSISSKEDAERNFLDQFDVEVTKHINYKNYVAKDIISDRIVLNGNRLFFLEPLESSSIQAYTYNVTQFKYFMEGTLTYERYRSNVLNYIKQLQNFVLWHYHFGSKYDTPFWDYAKTLSIEDKDFDEFLEYSKSANKYDIMPKQLGGATKDSAAYGQWPPLSFKVWYDGMTKH